MKSYLELLLLAALWGGSFLFLRMASPVFGPLLLIELRVLIAGLFLLPFLFIYGCQRELRDNWRQIAVLSLGNMCIPFSLIAWSTLSIGAGFASILNATVPFFTAVSAALIWRQPMTLAAIGGMVLGFMGVIALVAGNGGAELSLTMLPAVGAGLLAALLYGIAANSIGHNLRGVSGLAITTGSLGFSALFLLPVVLWQGQTELPGGMIWLAVVGLAIACTGVAYLLFYRLISRIGAYQTVSVTFLVPVFSILWGGLFLAERLTLSMVTGCILVLLGVAITTGRLRPGQIVRPGES
ncbi:MAG: hypothetical protein RLZZ385_31 [Pseudomonadota bacterium]